MAKKHKNKKSGILSIFNIKNSIDENVIEDMIDESVAHQISITEFIEHKAIENAEITETIEAIETVELKEEDEDEIKISPCVILTSADADIKVGGGFDFSAITDKFKSTAAVFSRRRDSSSSSKRSGSSSSSKKNSSLEKGSKKDNKSSLNKNNKSKNKKNSEKSSSKSNVVYLKDKISKAKVLSNMPANYIGMGVVGLVIVICLIWGLTHKNANEVYVNGKLVGVVNEKEITAEKLYNDAKAKLKTEKGVNIEVNEEITLKPVHASKKEVANMDYVLTEICKNFSYQVEAAAIVVDGNAMGIAENKAAAQKILDEISAKYVTEGAVVKERSFAQDVKIENKFVTNKEIETNETLIKKLTATTNEPKIHTVVSGDTLSSIARDAEMSLAELYQANPELNENSVLQLNQQINLVVPVPVLSVKIVEQVTYEEEFDAEPIVVENNQEYKTYEKIITEGSSGKRTVTAEITKVNGFEEGRKDIDSKVTAEPVAKKIERGTLQTPPKKAVGSFIYPTSGRLSSGYGARWGRTHKGIDLASSRGTPIYASDGGTVEFSGWNSGGYGYLIIINHGNGYQTYYGHNSKNVVSVGEKVYQGQLIGYVGSTGDSTGNHVHFEIRKNGSAKNPRNYLG